MIFTYKVINNLNHKSRREINNRLQYHIIIHNIL